MNLPWRVITLLLIAPLLEEAVFRAGLQEQLMRWRLRPWLCVLWTAVAFAIAHMLVRQQWEAAMLVAPGMLLGVVYHYTRSVLGCAALHAGMNALWLMTPALR
jgi:membrane protease YdiL (CAAX protease family)